MGKLFEREYYFELDRTSHKSAVCGLHNRHSVALIFSGAFLANDPKPCNICYR